MFSAAQFIEQAIKAMDKFEPQLAIGFLTRAFTIEATPKTAQLIGVCFLDLLSSSSGDNDYSEKASEWLKKSLELSQGQSWQANLSLGQLSAEFQAVQYFEAGVSQLRMVIESQVWELSQAR